MDDGGSVIEVDHHQAPKGGEAVCGDVFRSCKIPGESRVISVLSDGLGSGIKASVLATLTASMALKYAAHSIDIRKSAEIIMDTLPVCRERRISYSTFTIVDMDRSGRARIIEHGNPPFSFWSGGREVPVEKETIHLPHWKDRLIQFTRLQLRQGDRIVFASDGVTQAGTGRPESPTGWGDAGMRARIGGWLKRDPALSARDLSRDLVDAAVAEDGGRILDDLTCGVHYFREPRKLLVVTGPPFEKSRDRELAHLVEAFPGRKAICGGTTSLIVASHLKREVEPRDPFAAPGVPPGARMEGIDLVTEGNLTLARVASLLEERTPPMDRPADPAQALLALLLGSDVISFMVGTRMNEAHQDPSVPVELDLRRNIVRRIARLLEKDHCKETQIAYL